MIPLVEVVVPPVVDTIQQWALFGTVVVGFLTALSGLVVVMWKWVCWMLRVGRNIEMVLAIADRELVNGDDVTSGQYQTLRNRVDGMASTIALLPCAEQNRRLDQHGQEIANLQRMIR